MRGRVTDWKDDRGFGFIEPEAGGERVFFHISGVARGAPRPSTGSTVSFELSRSPDGKLRAINMGPAGFAAVSGKVISKRVVLSLAAILVSLQFGGWESLGKPQFKSFGYSRA